MPFFSTYRPLVVLFRRFLAPYRLRFVVGLFLAVVAGAVSSLHTLVFAPALHLFTGLKTAPAGSWEELSLSNLGPTLLAVFNLDPSNPVQIVVLVSVAYLLVAVAIAGLETFTKVIVLKIRVGLMCDMTQELHHYLIRQPMAYFNQRNVGDFLSRIGNDVREAARGIDSTLSGLLVAIIHIILSVLLLIQADVLLTIGILTLGCIHFGISFFRGPRFVKLLSRNYKHKGGINHLLMESFNGVRVVKTMAGERFMDRSLSQALDKWKISFYDSAFMQATDQPLRLLADSIVTSAALLLTFFSMHAGRMNLDAAALYIALCLRLIPPISKLNAGIFKITGSSAGAERVLEILEADRVIEDGDMIPQPLHESIRFHGVTFQYVPGEPVLKEIHLEIRKGEKIALVGPSGGGKSTFTDLLLRLYDPQEGTVLFDGQDIRDFQQRAYRRQFGVVNQDCLLFSGTVKENILYGREPDSEKYTRALEMANCDFVKDFPQGDQTQVGDRGITLSGGQRQRIALARAVYGRPELLILDEATSALDAESERLVQEGIQRAVKDATAILIAHRLSTVRGADRIVVLDAGKIEQIGKHEELLASSETYQKLCRLQFLPEGELDA